MWRGWSLLWHDEPDVLLSNGPGTAVALFALARLQQCCCPWRKKTRLIYVESFARVQTLSLTGRLLYAWVDHFVVQWPQLQQRYPKSVYLGKLL